MVLFQVKALYPYHSEVPDDLQFEKNAVIDVLNVEDDEWYTGFLDGKTGMFPKGFVERIGPTRRVERVAPKPPIEESPISTEPPFADRTKTLQDTQRVEFERMAAQNQSNERSDEFGDEEDNDTQDEEEAKRMELRERMARISGGMSMFGVPPPPPTSRAPILENPLPSSGKVGPTRLESDEEDDGFNSALHRQGKARSKPVKRHSAIDEIVAGKFTTIVHNCADLNFIEMKPNISIR